MMKTLLLNPDSSTMQFTESSPSPVLGPLRTWWATLVAPLADTSCKMANRTLDERLCFFFFFKSRLGLVYSTRDPKSLLLPKTRRPCATLWRNRQKLWRRRRLAEPPDIRRPLHLPVLSFTLSSVGGQLFASALLRDNFWSPHFFVGTLLYYFFCSSVYSSSLHIFSLGLLYLKSAFQSAFKWNYI